MIPRKLHYVWMGRAPKPYLIRQCIKTFHKQGCEVIEWNEDNFDVNSHPFVKAAYENKKWAFVSDYVRAYAIYHHGGIYLDTDVVIVGNMAKLFDNQCFVGFENKDFPFTAVFGATKGHPFLKDLLDYYDELMIGYSFLDNNTISTSALLIDKYGCQTGDFEQMLRSEIRVYRACVLCRPSKDSITIHLFLGSWLRQASVTTKLKMAVKSHFDNRCLFKAYLLFLKYYRNFCGEMVRWISF